MNCKIKLCTVKPKTQVILLICNPVHTYLGVIAIEQSEADFQVDIQRIGLQAILQNKSALQTTLFDKMIIYKSNHSALYYFKNSALRAWKNVKHLAHLAALYP